MRVLIYCEPNEREACRAALKQLASCFSFDLDVLSAEHIDGLAAWQALIDGELVQLHYRGTFHDRIRAACANQQYDVALIGLTDRKGVLRLLLGSRVGSFIHQTPTTVWLARPMPRPIHRIAVGVGGSPQTEQDARLAGLLAQATGAAVDLVHVVSQIPLLYASQEELYAVLLSRRNFSQIDPAVERLRQAYTLLTEMQVHVRYLLRAGTVVDQLLLALQGDHERLAADLLVIGAHQGFEGGQPDYLEDLAEQVAQAAPISTLIVHGESDWSTWQAALRRENG